MGQSIRTIDRKEHDNDQKHNTKDLKDKTERHPLADVGREQGAFLLTSRLKLPGLEFSEFMMGM